MTVTPSLVSIVDDDESVRESLPDLLKELGFAVQAFSSAEAFLESEAIGTTGCLILDIAMPGMSGLESPTGTGASDAMKFPSCSSLRSTSPTIRPRVLARGGRRLPVQAVQ